MPIQARDEDYFGFSEPLPRGVESALSRISIRHSGEIGVQSSGEQTSRLRGPPLSEMRRMHWAFCKKTCQRLASRPARVDRSGFWLIVVICLGATNQSIVRAE